MAFRIILLFLYLFSCNQFGYCATGKGVICVSDTLTKIISDDSYSIFSGDDEDDSKAFKVSGTLGNDGSLNLHIRTRIWVGRNRTQVRHRDLRGREQFEKIMEHFKGRVLTINAYWIYGDNLEDFNRLTGSPNNMDPKEAAEHTWTGEQALAYGFTTVVLESLTGSPGHYTEVSLHFAKPEI